MSIYTKTGDRGETGVFGGKRLPKDDVLIEALGSLDELNAALGLAVEETPELVAVQKDLMAICSRLAGYEIKLPETEKLEREIDRMWEEMPELSNFILPNSQLFWIRAVARRAERAVVRAKIKDEKVLKYLNRLSDYLFCLARWVNWRAGEKETVWRG